MSGRTIQEGSVDQYCEVKVWTTADGVPNTTLAFNTAVLAIWYQIGSAAPVEVVVGGSPAPATMTAGGAHADWGFYHIAQGRYKIGLTDAVVSAAANLTVWVVFTDCDSAPCEIDVVGYDKTDAVRLGMTALPNAAADAAGGLPISDAGALDLDALNTAVNAIPTTAMRGTDGANTVVPDAAGTIPSGMALETSVQTTLDRLGYTLAALAGNCADPQTAAETYSIILGANTFTIDHTGLDATGTRTTATLTKS